MVMNSILALVLAWMAGGALGAFFFGGLWWTVRKSLVSAWPALWVFGSFLLRTVGTMVGFYFVSNNDWQRALACLVGFVMARQVATPASRMPQDRPNGSVRETHHAP